MTLRRTLLLLSFILAASRGLAADAAFPDLKVAPWDGHKAACSLTFDDGDPCHLDVVVPELNRRHLHGTFFLIANHLDRKDEWRGILKDGHEIGNHTLDHLHAVGMAPEQEEAQVTGAQNVLQKEFGIPVLTFAYPFTEVTPSLEARVAKTHFLARGGYGGGLYIMTPDSNPDWTNLASHMTMSQLPFATYKSWVDEDAQKGGWLVFMIHGVLPTTTGWQPITQKMFGQILDSLQEPAKDIWVDTLLKVGCYFRAEKMFEKAEVKQTDKEKTWKWDLPSRFPQVTLKVKVDTAASAAGPAVELSQDGKALTADKDGFYAVDFAQKKLTLRFAK